MNALDNEGVILALRLEGAGGLIGTYVKATLEPEGKVIATESGSVIVGNITLTPQEGSATSLIGTYFGGPAGA